MGWRTVVISKRAKLDLKLGSVVIRSEDEIKKIHIDEISILMVESTAVSITAALIAELVKHKVRVIFCDETRSPLSEIQPLHGCFDSTLKIRNQIGWDKYYEVYKFCGYNKISVMLIENTQRERLENEKVVIIDDDLCEIY